jgi:hypothetical protein
MIDHKQKIINMIELGVFDTLSTEHVIRIFLNLLEIDTLDRKDLEEVIWALLERKNAPKGTQVEEPTSM